MTKGIPGSITYINHKGQTIFVSYTYFKGSGSERGESPTEIEINRAIGWMGEDFTGKLTKADREELEEKIYEKELYNKFKKR